MNLRLWKYLLLCVCLISMTACDNSDKDPAPANPNLLSLKLTGNGFSENKKVFVAVANGSGTVIARAVLIPDAVGNVAATLSNVLDKNADYELHYYDDDGDGSCVPAEAGLNLFSTLDTAAEVDVNNNDEGADCSHFGQTVSVDAVTQILTNNTVASKTCTNCHNSGTNAAGMDLSIASATQKWWDVMINIRSRVIPGNAQISQLYTRVNSGDMPRNAAKLIQADIDTIKTWIDEGAQAPSPPYASLSPNPQ